MAIGKRQDLTPRFPVPPFGKGGLGGIYPLGVRDGLSALVGLDPAVGAGGDFLALRIVFHGFRIEVFATCEVASGHVTSLICLPYLIEKLPFLRAKLQIQGIVRLDYGT